MKKIIIILSLILLCSCSADRNLYYNLHFDDYSIVVGYDDLEYINLVFDSDVKDKLEKKEEIKDIELFFFNDYFANIDIVNEKNKTIKAKQALVSRLDLYLANIPMKEIKIDDQILSRSVKENCEIFDGDYLSNNGYGCVFGKKVDSKYNYVILHGDILNLDQDELSRIEIYVK